MWIWRRIIKVSWTEHKTNEEVLKMVDTEKELMDTLRSRQKRWLCHIRRHDSLLRITLERRIQGKKCCGRPRTVFLNWLFKTEEDNIGVLKLTDSQPGQVRNGKRKRN